MSQAVAFAYAVLYWNMSSYKVYSAVSSKQRAKMFLFVVWGRSPGTWGESVCDSVQSRTQGSALPVENSNLEQKKEEEDEEKHEGRVAPQAIFYKEKISCISAIQDHINLTLTWMLLMTVMPQLHRSHYFNTWILPVVSRLPACHPPALHDTKTQMLLFLLHFNLVRECAPSTRTWSQIHKHCSFVLQETGWKRNQPAACLA